MLSDTIKEQSVSKSLGTSSLVLGSPASFAKWLLAYATESTAVPFTLR